MVVVDELVCNLMAGVIRRERERHRAHTGRPCDNGAEIGVLCLQAKEGHGVRHPQKLGEAGRTLP